VWAGYFLENAAKTWGIPAVALMSIFGLLVYFGYRHGDAYIGATIEASRAQTESSRVVAEAVIELRNLTTQNQFLQQKVVDQQESTSKTLMQIQLQMAEQNKVLLRLVDRME
jgi:hypothetical protein